MSQSTPDRPNGRETRLLLATIAVSIAVLVILARFRFPEATTRDVPEPAVQAPLERLAARATYDELAATMADLEQRVGPRLHVVRVEPERPGGPFLVAPRVTANRAVVLLGPGERLAAGADRSLPIIARHGNHDIAVLDAPPVEDATVVMRTTTTRPGPRYVAVAEGTAQGPVIRPVYVGRTDIFQDPRTGASLLSVAALGQPLPRGAAIFSLAGTFIGLAGEAGSHPMVVPADTLRVAAEAARADAETRGDLGVEVQALSPALARAAGADRGVVVSYVDPGGPAERVLDSGDVITAIDDTPVLTVDGFATVERSRTPGAPIRILLLRGGKPLEVKVVAADSGRITPPAPGPDPGLVMRAVAGLGIEVVSVRQNSSAAAAEIAPGDIIVRAAGRNAPAPAALLRGYRDLSPGAAIVLTIQRGNGHRVVALEKR